MKNEDIYQEWIKQRSHIEVNDGFTDDVMKRVYENQQKDSRPLIDVQRFAEWVSTHQLAKAGMIAAGAIVGFIRLAFMVRVLLFGS